MNPAMAAQYRMQQAQAAQQRGQHPTPPRRGVGPMVPGPHGQMYHTPNAKAMHQQQQQQRQQNQILQSRQVVQRAADKPTERNVPDGLEQLVIGNGVQEYKKLREVEKRIDAAMTRKLQELREQRLRSEGRTRKLRVWISNTVENQPWQGKELEESAFDFSSGSEATYKLQMVGKLLEEDGADEKDAARDANGHTDGEQDGEEAQTKPTESTESSQQRFSHFFKSITIEFDRNKALHQDASNIIEWKKPPLPPNIQNPPASADFDSLQFERKSDENINCTINLYRDERPERFTLSKELSEIVDMEEGTRHEVLKSLWVYTKAIGLQRDEEKRLIQCDDALRAIFKVDSIYFPQLNDAITPHLLPLSPIKLPYTIRVDPEYQANPTPTIYDVLVQGPDPLQEKMISIMQRNPEYVETLGDISRLDSEIALIVQTLVTSKSRHSFFTSMSKDPATFVRQWISSQKRDMEIILGDSRVGSGNEWMGDEFRRGGKDGVWGSENVKETVGLLVSRPGPWGR